jgi:hypothetical protein
MNYTWYLLNSLPLALANGRIRNNQLALAKLAFGQGLSTFVIFGVHKSFAI